MKPEEKAPTPETDAFRPISISEWWNFARKLERERNEARGFAEAYRRVWEKVSDAVDETPNHDPLPWTPAGAPTPEPDEEDLHRGLLAVWCDLGREELALYEKAREIIGFDPECELHAHQSKVYQAYTDALSSMLGDQSEWLDWFAWENDFGEKGMEAELNGVMTPIRTIEQLTEIISG